ncbi:outer dense fiber protein 2-like isoform X1 [Gigantopelta aegis]|uniref:outer dense fiber protein 2-like isoform X1 n=1 Tax=Gigantopelta aegis TaxID=1735272 RepID=UPI001B88978D|nr:outer dense fiber protein 2-like isoform X1 [Gigantopelta aegis]
MSKGMGVEPGLRPTSPVHVHVEEDVPVHVHIKKGTKKGKLTKSIPSTCIKKRGKLHKSAVKSVVGSYSADNLRSSRLRRSTSSSRVRSHSPGGGPWVPPPGKTSRGSKSISWQGPTHRLEINPTKDLLITDLSTDEEERVHGQMQNYEKKIDHLMSEVGSLKNEVELQNVLSEMEKKDDLLQQSQHVIEKQELDLQDFQQELSVTERQNRLLRQSMDLLGNDFSSKRDLFRIERETLMKKLIEVEMDGQAVSQQVRELRDSVLRLREEPRLSATDVKKLSNQKERLLEKMADFEATNQCLRLLLREQHQGEAVALRVVEQKEVLIQKLTDSERVNERLRAKVIENEQHVRDVWKQVTAQKEEILAMRNIQTSMESTRAHLQKQLRQKEADCNRMAVQIRTIEGNTGQYRTEIEHLQSLLDKAKDKLTHDKESLKKATRAQKQRAERNEEALERLSAQLVERERLVAHLQSEIGQYDLKFESVDKERAVTQVENNALNTRIKELENLLDRVEENSKSQVDEISVRVHEKNTELSTLRLENDRLKSSVINMECKFKQTEEEMVELRKNLKQYEKITEEYKDQMNKSRREADDTIVRLEVKHQENGRLQHDSEVELELVKVRLQQRLQELEPLPELLRATELKLQCCNDQLLGYERKNTENTKLIAEFTAKVEHMSETLDQMRGNFHGVQDENRTLLTKMDNLERKLCEVEEQNRELLATVAKREEAIHQNNLRLEEKTRENASLTRQLENALSDNRRQMEQARDRFAAKERTYQTRIVDLETQLSQLRSEIARTKREKEENERKFNSRLYDLKDRLEQCHSTNRSMQNYVQFLKNSYANVFGDTSVAMPTSPIKPGLP